MTAMVGNLYDSYARESLNELMQCLLSTNTDIKHLPKGKV
jgi:hypothetical protein